MMHGAFFMPSAKRIGLQMWHTWSLTQVKVAPDLLYSPLAKLLRGLTVATLISLACSLRSVPSVFWHTLHSIARNAAGRRYALNASYRYRLSDSSFDSHICLQTYCWCTLRAKSLLSTCILQVKLPNGNRGGALCPYCKAEFSVMFRGAQTAEERAASHAEEQRITEATLRAREVILISKELRAFLLLWWPNESFVDGVQYGQQIFWPGSSCCIRHMYTHCTKFWCSEECSCSKTLKCAEHVRSLFTQTLCRQSHIRTLISLHDHSMQAENARNEEKATKLRIARAEETAASQKSLNLDSGGFEGRVNSPVARRSLFTEKTVDGDSSSHGRRVRLSFYTKACL